MVNVETMLTFVPWLRYTILSMGVSVRYNTNRTPILTRSSVFPDLNVGLTVLTAETLASSEVRSFLPFTLADVVLPILDEIAKDQASAHFGGHYSSKETNSSLTLTTDGSYSGLKVTQLISNGVNLFAFYSSAFPSRYIKGAAGIFQMTAIARAHARPAIW